MHRRVARRAHRDGVMTKPQMRRGIVLGGGGVLGAAWMIGALQALTETYDWDPREATTLIGTSAGSVLAGLLGSGIGVDTLVNHQRGVPGPGDPQIDFDHEPPGGGVLPPRPQLRLGSRALLAQAARHPRRMPPLVILAGFAPRGRARLDSVGALIKAANPGGGWAPHPATWIVTMDYETGRGVAFARPGAPDARRPEPARAWGSIPGGYEPAVIGGRRYVDGGTL